MGSSSWSIDLERLPDATPAARAEVKDTTRRLLTETWRAALPASDYKRANSWVSMGIDSLLAIGDAAECDEEYDEDDRDDEDDEDEDDEDEDDEDDDEKDEDDRDQRPATQLTFSFYDSVEWALTLAQHWLVLGLAACRPHLEAALRELGYRVTAYIPANLEWRFVREGARTGLVTSEGVEWQMPRYDERDNDEALAPQTRAAAERVRATGQCECAFCTRER